MQTLLFSPQGRILKRRFWQGLVVVTVGAVILQAAQGRRLASRLGSS